MVENQHLPLYMQVSFNFLSMLKGRIFVLTVSDEEGMVPRSRITLNKSMYLLHRYRNRKTRVFGDIQI